LRAQAVGFSLECTSRRFPLDPDQRLRRYKHQVSRALRKQPRLAADSTWRNRRIMSTTRRSSGPGNHDRGHRRSGSRGASDSSREARIGQHIEPQADGCWLYKGKREDYVTAPSMAQPLHRWVYETLVGPIPEGMWLHHECETKGCCNPAHLTPMSPSDHVSHHAALRRESESVRAERRLH
jgi:hypothetical protein